MDRAAVLRQLMQKVHKAVARARPSYGGTRSFYSVTLKVPGFGSKMEINGESVLGLLVPDLNIPEAERLETLTGLVSHLGDPVLDKSSRALLRGRLGRQVLDFALCASTPQGRLCRLLIAFGKGAKVELDVAKGTLVVHDASGEYGVRERVMVGGIFAGTPMTLPLEELFQEEVTVLTRSSTMTEIRRTLHNRIDQDAYRVFCLLYAVAEWDKTVIINSLLMPKPRRVTRSLTNLASSLLEHPTPYTTLYKALVPFFMTYSDFVATFGNPDNRGNVGQRARTLLINKLYMLPFFE